MISNRVNSIKPSLTIPTNMKAQELKRAGRDIIVLAAGEPDFDTPDHIKNAAIKAINDGFTKYVPGKGTPDLQSAIQKKFKEDNNLDYDLSNITVGVGGKHIIYNAFSATINSGDEVPNAITVIPITNLDILNDFARETAPLTSNSAPPSRIIKPKTSKT